LATATSESLLEEFRSHLRKTFTITVKPFDQYLGITIKHCDDGTKQFTKPFQLERLFEKWLPKIPKGTRVPDTPMTPEYGKLHQHPDSPRCNITEYQQCLGAVMQVAVDVRIDVSFATSKCSQRTHDCREEDMKALLRVVHYLYITKTLGLVLRPGISRDEGRRNLLKLRAFCDANYASMSNGRSQVSYGFDLLPTTLEGEAIQHGYRETSLFASKLVTASDTALSSCDAEITGVCETLKTTIHVRCLLKELHQEQLGPTPIYNDNESCIRLGMKYSGEHKRVRYMLPKINFIMEHTQAGTITLLHMPGVDLPPDMHTKALPGPAFKKKRVRYVDDVNV
jgi:hypothetical protein